MLFNTQNIFFLHLILTLSLFLSVFSSIQIDMSVNSSSNSSSNSSLPPPPDCTIDTESLYTFTALLVAYILLLPFFILVLYMGYQRWRKRGSASGAAMMSHSDVFTFNMVAMDLICVLGSCFFCYGLYAKQLLMMQVWMDIYCAISPGQTLIHLLTCLERYLAVVHPVTYLGLRQTGGARARNITIGFVWLICFASVGLSKLNKFAMFSSLLFLTFAVIVVSFCSLSVLCVLIRPGPGERGGKRERVDRSKQRAFVTILVIMPALFLKFLAFLVLTIIHLASELGDCEAYSMVWPYWFSLPSSLVLPLLFLHRARNLPG